MLVTPYFNPAFRPSDVHSTPTPSPHDVIQQAPEPALSSMDTAGSSTEYQQSLSDIPLIDDGVGSRTPKTVSAVENRTITEYPSGASVTSNVETNESQFSNMAPLQAGPDPKDLDVDQFGQGEALNTDGGNSFTFDSDSVPVNLCSVVTDADVKHVSERMPELIFDDSSLNSQNCSEILLELVSVCLWAGLISELYIVCSGT